MKKLFGGIDLTWKKLIFFAVLAGLYTGAMAILPVTKNTSFRDITVTFECWIFFGTLIILNSKSPLDSALKCFVFFLISQPLVYLVQVPFYQDGWAIFGFYRNWILWTILTFPMGYIGWYLKKNKWWGLLILTPVMLFLGLFYERYLAELLTFFPQHLLTVLFCLLVFVSCGLYAFEDPKLKKIQLALIALIILGMTFWAVTHKASYHTSILPEGISLKGDETVSFSDERFGPLTLQYNESLEEYLIDVDFHKLGKTELTIETPAGETYIYELDVSRNSYEITRKQ